MYALLDFGDGRRLERFGPLLLDRPCPTTKRIPKLNPTAWNSADAVFVEEKNAAERGRWEPKTERGRNLSTPWSVDFGTLTLELRTTPFGHVGAFPEQVENWARIRTLLGEAAGRRSPPIRVLNLFAYTGGSTLAAASVAENIEVVHVDAAKNLLSWAKRNAELNGLQHKKIRWIAEDARKFVRRELKRNNRYNAVILDPPSYGHGPDGEVWKLTEHLPGLLDDLFRLIEKYPLFLLLTAHTPNIDLAAMFPGGCVEAPPMFLRAETGERLPMGNVVCLRIAPRQSTNEIPNDLSQGPDALLAQHL